MRHSTGLSTLEILIGCAIVALLTAMSLPSFHQQAGRAHRTEALAALGALLQAQEQHRAQHARYAASITDLTPREPSETAHYLLSTSTQDETAALRFRVQAQARQAHGGDADCRFLAIDAADGSLQERSGPTGTLDNDAALNRWCWRR